MPLGLISNVRMAGVAAAVPKRRVANHESDLLTAEEQERMIKAIGVRYRRVAEPGTCSSDLCFAAAEQLLSTLCWTPASVEALIFISQSPDYVLPATAITLQARLGLPMSCLAFDINLGCSGYVYGLAVLGGLLSSLRIRRGLLLTGETSSKMTSPRDRSVASLFGDAGTATALELGDGANPIYFDLSSDGNGWRSIHIPAGGYRKPVTAESFVYGKAGEGIERNETQLILDGAEVFNFSLREVPKSVHNVLSFAKRPIDSVDYFLFHQANLMMNEFIRKKMKISEGKMPYSLPNFGNTSSAAIPLTLVTNTEVAQRAALGRVSWLMCGFGVGLSWGSALVETDRLKLPDLVEI